MASIELFAEQQDNTGEGPLWSMSDLSLYWIDIGRKVLYRKGNDGQTQSWQLPDYPGCLAEISGGGIAVAFGKGVQRLDLRSGAATLMRAAPPRRPGTRFNDGKVDPLGRFWVGTMQNNFGPNGEPIALKDSLGALYRFDRDGTVHTIEEDVGCANTLAWSPDLRRFYFADSLRGQIYVYDFDVQTGRVRDKRVFFEAGQCGIPDGSAIDVDGCLWNARWDGSAILRITPEGKVDRVIELPVRRPTSCAFGGPALDTLYVTSARNDLSAVELARAPCSGSVFAITGAGQGLPVPPMVCDSRDG